MYDQDIIGIIHIIVSRDICRLQLLQERLTDLDLSVKARQYSLAFQYFVIFILWNDAVDHGVIDRYGRTAYCKLAERIISVLSDIFEEEITAETGRVTVDLVCMELPLYIFDHRRQVSITFAQKKIFAGVIAVTGPVKGHDTKLLMFGYELTREFFSRFVVFVASESVAEDHRFLYTMHIAAVQLAPDAVSRFINIKIFLHFFLLFRLLIRLSIRFPVNTIPKRLAKGAERNKYPFTCVYYLIPV